MILWIIFKSVCHPLYLFLKIMCSRMIIIDWGCECWGRNNFEVSLDIHYYVLFPGFFIIFWMDRTWFTSLTYRVFSIYPLPSSPPKELLCKPCLLNRKNILLPWSNGRLQCILWMAEVFFEMKYRRHNSVYLAMNHGGHLSGCGRHLSLQILWGRWK